jgi:plastocyanin
MFGRRILVLVAVLMGLTALAASLSPPPESLRQGRRTPAASPSPGVTPAPSAAAGRTVAAHFAAAARQPQRITAAVGDTVDLTVTGDVLDTVVIPGLAVSEPVDRYSPAQVQLYADTPGRYPVRLLDAGRRIGVLRITRD